MSLTELLGRRPWVVTLIAGIGAFVLVFLGHDPGLTKYPGVHLDCSSALLDTLQSPRTLIPVKDASGVAVLVADYNTHVDCAAVSSQLLIGIASSVGSQLREALTKAGLKLGPDSTLVCTYCHEDQTRFVVCGIVAFLLLLLIPVSFSMRRKLRQSPAQG